MPTATWTPMANITLGSSASSVTFSNIPSTPYRDLIAVLNIRNSASTNYPQLRFTFNSDTGSNYNYVFMGAWDGTPASGSGSNDTKLFGLYTEPSGASGYSPTVIQIMDYSATDKHKSVLIRGNSQAYAPNAIAGRWASTNAISSIQIFSEANGWASGSTFALYGVIA